MVDEDNVYSTMKSLRTKRKSPLREENIVKEPEYDLNTISYKDLFNLQRKDKFCKNIKRDLITGDDSYHRKYYFLDEGEILHIISEGGPKIDIPEKLTSIVLNHSHYGNSSGHPGSRRMYSTLRKHVY